MDLWEYNNVTVSMYNYFSHFLCLSLPIRLAAGIHGGGDNLHECVHFNYDLHVYSKEASLSQPGDCSQSGIF